MRVVAGVASLAVLVLAGVAGAAGSDGTIVFAADRAPTLAGEVERITPDGKKVDLSRSPAPDAAPALSPDGKLVAFSSGRGGKRAEYVVGVDGKGLRRVSPFLGPGDVNQGPMLTAAWSPDGRSLAVLVSPYSPGVSRIYLASPHGGVWRALTKPADKALGLLGWSGPGLAYVSPDSGSVRVIDSRGRVLLDAAGVYAWWSPLGRLAVKRSTNVMNVYDARLRLRATVAGDTAAWSPAGVLATVTRNGVLALRRDGVGSPSRTVRISRSGATVQWVGAQRLRYFGPDGWVLVDARTGHTFLAAGAYAVWNSVVSKNGTVAIGERWKDGNATLLRTRLGGSTKAIASTGACGPNGLAWENLQLLPDGSAVFDTAFCLVSADIYAVTGGRVTQLTKTATDESEPALSPDGTRIAFSTRATADGCKGCDWTLWMMNADGTGAHAFPNGPDPDVNFDDSPSFSPDGTTILFARSGPSAASLYTVPATGGTATPLGVDGLYPVWGPTKIAYTTLDRGLTVADPDGKNAVLLHVEGAPAFSGSGRLAVMRMTAAGTLSIYFTDTKRSIALPQLRGTYRGVGLAWSPDGSRLAFAATDTQGIGDVWTIGVDGTGLTRVTRNLGAAGTLSWR